MRARAKRLLLCLGLTLTAGCGTYDPCADRACGDPCTECDPDDDDCVETATQKVCNRNAICTTALPAICS